MIAIPNIYEALLEDIPMMRLEFFVIPFLFLYSYFLNCVRQHCMIWDQLSSLDMENYWPLLWSLQNSERVSFVSNLEYWSLPQQQWYINWKDAP